MIIYFVRHGESEGNVSKIHQAPETPLSNQGIAQAQLVKQRLHAISFETIVCSDYRRAQHTAQIIQADTKVPIIETVLLREHRLPSEMKGLAADHPQARLIKESLIAAKHDPDYHFSDEENLSDLITRGRVALEFLRCLPHQTLVVVTHGNFLKCMSLCIVFEALVSPALIGASFKNLKTTNTGITMAEYSDSSWKLITWNDSAHLA